MLKSVNQLHDQHGFTFTELMVALAINAFLFAAIISVFVANLDHYRRTINLSRLNQQLHTAIFVMSNEIRRAGYWSNASSNIGGSANNNPFMASGTDITIPAGNQCILFTYDRDNDGALPSISSSIDDERYGFRLNGTALQARPAGAAFSCTAAASSWENMLDTNVIQITALSFTTNFKTLTTGPGSKGITTRGITISITGQLTSDNTITKTLTQYVRVRNDLISF